MTAIISGIGKAATSIVSVGKNIVTGLWSGVSSMISWATPNQEVALSNGDKIKISDEEFQFMG